MRIETILAGLKQEPKPPAKAPEKTAADKADPAAPPREALLAALSTALAGTEKRAEAAPSASPVDDIMKTAAEILAADKEAAAKEASVLGQAFGDACVARLDTWLKHAQDLLSSSPAPGSATPEALKEAAVAGYRTTRAELEKSAQSEYDHGWNDTVEVIYKAAAEEFVKGAQAAATFCEAVAA
jgi:hypothetical protein